MTNPRLESKSAPTTARTTGSEKPATSVARGALRQQLRASPYAVGAGLLRPQSETSDPRLDYNAEGTVGPGGTPQAPWTDPEGAGLDATRLPFTKHGVGWDAQQILSRWTQIDRDQSTVVDATRCGGNSSVSVAVMSGPAAVIAFCVALAQEARRRNATEENQQRQNRLSMVAGLAPGVADQVQARTATYGSLSLLAECAMMAFASNPWTGASNDEAAGMAGMAGPSVSLGVDVKDRATFDARLRELRVGEAYMCKVDTDSLAKGTAADTKQENHFVTVGREPATGPAGTGRIYLYDPWPRTGSQLRYQEDRAFWTLFTTADGRWKAVTLVSKTRPEQVKQQHVDRGSTGGKRPNNDDSPDPRPHRPPNVLLANR